MSPRTRKCQPSPYLGEAWFDRNHKLTVNTVTTLNTILLTPWAQEPRKGDTMTSDKQAEANRRNALKSTGPNTPEGMAAVRHNPVKHGLLSRDVLLPGEDEAALKGLGERMRDELQPVGELEGLLVDRIIYSAWRLQRLGRIEAGVFAFELYGELAERARQEADKYPRTETEVMIGGYKLGGEVETAVNATTTDKQKHQAA